MVNLNTMTWVVAIIGSSISSFFLGIWSERAKTERKINHIKKQILILSNSDALEYEKLVHLCATYQLSLDKLSDSDIPEIRELRDNFEPIRILIKNLSLGFLERYKFRRKVNSTKKQIIKDAENNEY